MELKNKKSKDANDVNTSSLDSTKETQPCDDASSDINATPPPRLKHKKKDGEGPKSPSVCRFCNELFTSPQALGGHLNSHRRERKKEEFQKAEILIHTEGQTYTLRYPSVGASPSYYQCPDGGMQCRSEGNCGNHYHGGGTPMANAASMMGNTGGGLQRQVYQNSNQQQFVVGAPQMNPNYGIQQQTTQANYQSQPQQGGSYVNYNQYDNAPRPPHISTGVQQTSYTPQANSGQYQAQGTRSLQDVRAYVMPHGGLSIGVGHHQSNTGFTSHNLSQAAGGASTPTLNNVTTLKALAGSNVENALRQSIANQAVAQFVDQSGNIVIQGPSSAYSTKLHPLDPSHFHNNIQATEFDQGTVPQVSNAGTSTHGTTQVQSDQYAAVGMEN